MPHHLKYHCLFVITFFLLPSLYSQNKIKLSIQAGPSITNVFSYWKGQKIRYKNPEKPLFKTSFHVGGGISYQISESFYASGSVVYEKKMSAEGKFNGTTESAGHFVGIPIILGYCPSGLRPGKMSLEFGIFSDYLVYSDIFNNPILYSTRIEYGFIAGFRVNILNNLSTSFRWNNPVNFIYKETDTPLKSGLAIKTTSIQISFNYEI
ncbi:MAG: hypothetical protein R2879_06795 [Saprospiraceae bacterium]